MGRKAKFSVDYILETGQALMQPFNTMSKEEFTDYIRERYNLSDQHALAWIRATDRFKDDPKLIEGLTDTIICKLASPKLTNEKAVQIIKDLHDGRIKRTEEAVELAIRQAKYSVLLNETVLDANLHNRDFIEDEVNEASDGDDLFLSRKHLLAAYHHSKQKSLSAQLELIAVQEKIGSLRIELATVEAQKELQQSTLAKIVAYRNANP